MELLGYEVTAIADSEEALRIFRENPDRFDLVITDQSMPNMNGEALIEEIRKFNSMVPVILYTGFIQGLNMEDMKAIGIAVILEKPLGNQEMAQAIREVLDHAGGRRQAGRKAQRPGEIVRASAVIFRPSSGG